MTTRIGAHDSSADRYRDLARMLEERRREILGQVQSRMRDVRATGASGERVGVVDAAETFEADVQEDIELALLQMKSEMLVRIDEALGRIAEGTYGFCDECGDPIAEKRLMALPFAIRCRYCQDQKESAERQRTRRGDDSWFGVRNSIPA